MVGFVKGEVVIVRFPFSDLTSIIKRPALVVANLKGNDLILCQITSKHHEKDPYEVELKIKDFESKGLKKDSFIKPSNLFTTRDSSIIYKAGKISKNKIKKVEKMICKIIKS